MVNLMTHYAKMKPSFLLGKMLLKLAAAKDLANNLSRVLDSNAAEQAYQDFRKTIPEGAEDTLGFKLGKLAGYVMYSPGYIVTMLKYRKCYKENLALRGHSIPLPPELADN